jgi:hypothetical protein
LSRRGPATAHASHTRAADGCGIFWRPLHVVVRSPGAVRSGNNRLAPAPFLVDPVGLPSDSHTLTPCAAATCDVDYHAVQCAVHRIMQLCDGQPTMLCWDESGRMQVTARGATQQQQMTAALSARLALITTLLRRRDEVVRLVALL